MNPNSFRAPSIRQPSAMRSPSKKVTFDLKSSETSAPKRTPREIIDAKMAAMAADPAAEIVYWTENGPDPKGWDIIFPEYKVLTEAFNGGYGWYDLTEGRGQHLIPKLKPYKIVNITSAELKAMRSGDEERDALAAALAAAKAAQEEKEAEERAAALAAEKKAQLDKEAEERAAALAAAKAAQEDKEAEERAAMAKEDVFSQEVEKPVYIAHAVTIIMADIRALPNEHLCLDFLVDFITNRLYNYKSAAREAINIEVCKTVEKEGLLVVTQPSSPTVPSIQVAVVKPPPVARELEPHNYADIPNFFKNNPPFNHVGYKYVPFVNIDGRKLFVPEIYLHSALHVPLPLPPLLSATPPRLNPFEMKKFLASQPIRLASDVFIPSVTFDGKHIFVSERNITAFVNKTCASTAPPALPLPPQKTCCKSRCQICHPLPVVKAVIVNRPPPSDIKIIKAVTLYPPNIRIQKLRMPRMKRLQQLIA